MTESTQILTERQSLREPLTVDLETAPHPVVADFIDPPDLKNIQAPKNYVKPEAIADYILRETENRKREHAEKVGKAALDWNVSRIVALGVSVGGNDIDVLTAENEEEERRMLQAFWIAAKHRDIVGFRSRTFDVPTLVQRSRLLNVPHRTPNLARYGKGSVIDLYDILTFDDARQEAVMSRSLKSFAKRFGLPVDDAIDGADIPRLVAEGKWDQVISHVTSDVRLTVALARRIGVLETPVPVTVGPEQEPF